MMWLNECWSRWASGMGSGGIHIMPFFWLLILIGFFVFLIWLGRREKSFFKDRQDQPLDILKRRYAQGEISKDEFDRIKKNLVRFHKGNRP